CDLSGSLSKFVRPDLVEGRKSDRRYCSNERRVHARFLRSVGRNGLDKLSKRRLRVTLKAFSGFIYGGLHALPIPMPVKEMVRGVERILKPILALEVQSALEFFSVFGLLDIKAKFERIEAEPDPHSVLINFVNCRLKLFDGCEPVSFRKCAQVREKFVCHSDI